MKTVHWKWKGWLKLLPPRVKPAARLPNNISKLLHWQAYSSYCCSGQDSLWFKNSRDSSTLTFIPTLGSCFFSCSFLLATFKICLSLIFLFLGKMYDMGAFHLFTKSWPHQKVPIKGLSVHLEKPFRLKDLINIYPLSFCLTICTLCFLFNLAAKSPNSISGFMPGYNNFLSLVSIVYTKL